MQRHPDLTKLRRSVGCKHLSKSRHQELISVVLINADLAKVDVTLTFCASGGSCSCSSLQVNYLIMPPLKYLTPSCCLNTKLLSSREFASGISHSDRMNFFGGVGGCVFLKYHVQEIFLNKNEK